MAQISIAGWLLGDDAPRPPSVPSLCTGLIKWEGCRREMYADARGNVVTGIGHRLPDARAALALPWCHRTTGRRATPAEIRVAFAQVRAQACGHPAPAHHRASDLVLPAGFAAELAAKRLEGAILPGLRRLLSNFDRCPAAAQRALIDMAFDIGVAELGRFHNLVAACRRADFLVAADHCHRRTSHAARNAATRALFREAANPFAAENARRDGGQR